MKKHLTSIESTRPAQQKSLFSYHHNNYNNNIINNNIKTSTMSLIITDNNNNSNNNTHINNNYNNYSNTIKSNYKRQLNNMFKTLQQILKIRSYLLQRDMQQIYYHAKQFFQRFLSIYSVEGLVAFVYSSNNYIDKNNNNNNNNMSNNNNTNNNQKLYQHNQLHFIINIIFELNKQKHQSASNSNIKQFQLIKQLIQYIQQKSIKYQQFIKQMKVKKLMQMKVGQYDQRRRWLGQYENRVKREMGERHEKIKQVEMEKLTNKNNNYNNNNNDRQQQKTQQRLKYITNPSKQLSQAKQLSLRVKLSPYASQKKRQYDYSTLNKKLSQTIDQDMMRKCNLLDKMKTIQKEKLQRMYKRRYSVVEDNIKEDKNLTERNMLIERQRLNKSLNNELYTISNNSNRKKNNILSQLKNSLNAFNMHSDTQEIKKIIKHHRNSLQFGSSIKQVSNLRTVSEYEPKYATLTYLMSKSREDQQQQQHFVSMRQKQRQQNRILRRLANKHKDNDNDNMKNKRQQLQCQYDLINNSIIDNKSSPANAPKTTTINKQNSLVAFYDDQLEVKNDKKK